MKKVEVGALILLLATTLQAAEPAPANFRIEVLIHKQASGPTSTPIECLYGCAWQTQTIECPAETKECRVIIDGRFGVEPWSQELRGPETILPVSGSVCLGFGPGMPRGTGEHDAAPAGILVRRLEAESPARLAGFQDDDVLVSFNSQPVRIQEPFNPAEMFQGLTAGDKFEATLERNGALIQVTGHLGTRTSVGKCLPADPGLMAMPPMDITPETPFSLALDALENAEVRCLEGCPWVIPLRYSACPPTQTCSFTLRSGEVELGGQDALPNDPSHPPRER
jgi:hypothetical protein